GLEAEELEGLAGVAVLVARAVLFGAVLARDHGLERRRGGRGSRGVARVGGGGGVARARAAAAGEEEGTEEGHSVGHGWAGLGTSGAVVNPRARMDVSRVQWRRLPTRPAGCE